MIKLLKCILKGVAAMCGTLLSGAVLAWLLVYGITEHYFWVAGGVLVFFMIGFTAIFYSKPEQNED